MSFCDPLTGDKLGKSPNVPSVRNRADLISGFGHLVQNESRCSVM